jgi:hypothetical protein
MVPKGFFPLLVAVMLSAAAAACSASDPGQISYGPGRQADGVGPAPTSSSPSPDAGAPGSDSGATGDSGADADAGNVFADAAAYASSPVDPTAAQNHATLDAGVTPNYKVDCLSCHDGKSVAVKLLLGGTVYTDTNASKGAGDVEVRVVDNHGLGLSVQSDADGNFWIVDQSDLATPAAAGARSATTMQLMPQAVTSGGCNSCHNNNVQQVLHVP